LSIAEIKRFLRALSFLCRNVCIRQGSPES
jgi:hypothetical protein